MSKPWRPKTMTFEGGSSESCRIWNLESKKEDDIHYVRLIDGLINNITASNIGEWVEIQENGFLVLELSASGGSIVSFELVFSLTPPDPIEDSENTPVPSFQIFFARVSEFSAISKFFSALSIIPYITRVVGIVPTQPAQDTDVRYYTWKIHES